METEPVVHYDTCTTCKRRRYVYACLKCRASTCEACFDAHQCRLAVVRR